MKPSRLAWLLVSCACPTLLQAQSGIQILSQSYSINATWQDGGSSRGTPAPVAGGYNLSSSNGSPVSASSGSASGRVTASASIDLFAVYQSAIASDGYDGDWNYIWGRAQQTVQADWLFCPIVDSLDFTINASKSATPSSMTSSGFTLTLSDVTDATVLLNFDTAQNGNGLEADYTYAVNPSDIYKFSISGWANTFPNNGWESFSHNINASITSVPEPTTALLLLSALAGLAGCKVMSRSRISN